MTPHEALAAAEAAGISLRAEGGKLFASPKPVPPEVAELLQAHKEALLRTLLLRQQARPMVEELGELFPEGAGGQVVLLALPWPDGTCAAVVEESWLERLKAWHAQRLALKASEGEAEAQRRARQPQGRPRGQPQPALAFGSAGSG